MTLFAYGFRPFFLFAAAYAAITVPASLVFYFGFGGDFGEYWPANLWHAHEMIFGYTVAVIAGFLLTAAPGWRKTTPVTGPRLALLVLIWAAGRAAMWGAVALPAWAVAVLDLAFIPALMVLGLAELWALRAQRHRVFLIILGLLFVANGLFHAATAGYLDGALGLNLAVGMIALLITVLGGRVTPSFTRGALEKQGLSDAVTTSPRAGGLAIGAVAVMVIADLAATLTADTWPALDGIAAGLALAAAAVIAWRLAGWATRHVLDKPIVWVLHLGYGWLAVGLAMKGLAGFDIMAASDAVHGFTIGAIGTMTLAIMSRAGLGHTGRPMVAAPLTVAAYLLVTLAAVARIMGSEILMIIAAAAWTAAFVAFLMVYAPLLLSRRPDGKPG